MPKAKNNMQARLRIRNFLFGLNFSEDDKGWIFLFKNCLFLFGMSGDKQKAKCQKP